jgi:hypothetical protein
MMASRPNRGCRPLVVGACDRPAPLSRPLVELHRHRRESGHLGRGGRGKTGRAYARRRWHVLLRRNETKHDILLSVIVRIKAEYVPTLKKYGRPRESCIGCPPQLGRV